MCCFANHALFEISMFGLCLSAAPNGGCEHQRDVAVAAGFRSWSPMVCAGLSQHSDFARFAHFLPGLGVVVVVVVVVLVASS